MKKYFVLILFAIVSCKNFEKTVKGEVYVKLIDFVNLYGSSNNEIHSFKEKMNKMKESDIPYDVETKNMIEYYEFLIEHDLFERPFFKLKIDNNKIITVFTNENEYEKLKINLEHFKRDKEIIVIEFKGLEKKEGLYFTDNILLVKKKEGVTSWEK